MSDQNNGFNQAASAGRDGAGGRGGARGGAVKAGDTGIEAGRTAPPARRLAAGVVDTFA
jgi:flagellar hook-length control protein FliK